MSDDTPTIRDRLGSAARALLAPSQDGDPSPQARDERPIVIGRREHTDEPGREDIEEWRDAYRENPLIRVPIQNFAGDVTEPGASVAVPTDGEGDIPTVPTDYPDEVYRGLELDTALELWLANCYVDGWDFDADIADLLEAVIKDRRGRRGTAIVEHAYDDPRQRERILALRPIKAETMTAYTREGKGIVLRPDDDPNEFESVAVQDLADGGRDTAPTTPAGKTAALAQFDDVYGASERDEIPFALDDVTVSPYDADTGELFGRPDTAPVVDRAQAVYDKLQHIDQAILNTAFANIIAKVDTSDEDVAKKIRDDLDINSPETVSGTNVPTEIIELEGAVPDAVSQIQQEIEFVLSAMPTPLYRVGFAGDINRDITGEQREDYRDDVKRERRRLEADFETVLRLKATEFLHGDAHSDEDLDVTPELRLRPEEAESPLRDEEFDASEFQTLMAGLSEAAGARGGAEAILPQREIVGTLLDMDADEILGEDTEAAMEALDEADPRVRETFAGINGAALEDELPEDFDECVAKVMEDEDFSRESAEFVCGHMRDPNKTMEVPTEADLATFSEGDEVDTPDGVGVVVEIRTSDFEGPDGDVEASEDSPAYVVGTESGAEVYRASALESTTIDVDVDNPEAQLAADGALEANLQDGHFQWPESWKESDTPARLIALKAWAGLGGRFTTCRREMAGEIASPARFCADFKDRILGWEGWRSGGD